jgi:homoserine acetyltransferase
VIGGSLGGHRVVNWLYVISSTRHPEKLFRNRR